MSSLVGSTTTCCHTLLSGELSMSLCNSTGRGHLEAYTSFFLGLVYVPFHFADLGLYPFTVVNCNCDYNTISESYKSFR